MTAENLYDLTLLLDARLDDKERNKLAADVEAIITKHGEIVDRRDWGVRKTTFRLNKHLEADYRLVQFHGTNELLAQLDHSLKIIEGVLRFRIIKTRPGNQAPANLKHEFVAIAEEEVTSS